MYNKQNLKKERKYEIGLYEKAMPSELTWNEKFELAKGLGYDYVEISVDETDAKLARLEWTKEERMKLIREMENTGIRIRSMSLSGHRKYPLGSADPRICARSMEIMEKAVRLASDLGIRIIQLAGYDVYYEESTEETVQRFSQNLKKATLMAAKEGIMLGFETMETPFMNTVEKSIKYVNLINSPYLGIYPDSGNLKNASVSNGMDVYKDLKLGRGHVVALHLKETTPGKFREVPFGTGHVDFEGMISTAWEMGVRLFVTEMWYVGQKSWQEDIQFAHDKMCNILDMQN